MERRKGGMLLWAACLLFLWACAQAPAQNPYRYRFAPTSGTELNHAIEFHRERADRNSKGFLERATLAGLLLQKAQLERDPALFEEARQQAEQSLQTFDNGPARLVLAQLDEVEHRFEAVVEKCSRIVREAPGQLEAVGLLVSALIELGRLEEAEAALAPIAQLPTPGAISLKGRLQLAQGRLEQAMESYQRVIAKEQMHEVQQAGRTRIALARIHRYLKQPKKARQALEAASMVSPREGEVLREWGRLEMEEGQLTEASELFARAFTMMKEGGPLVDLGRARHLEGRNKERDAAWEQAEKLLTEERQQGHYGHGRELALLYLWTGRLELAQQVMQEELGKRRDLDTLLVAIASEVQAEELRAELLDRGWSDKFLTQRLDFITQK